MGSVSGSSVSTMKVFALILLVAAVSAKDIRIQVNAPPDELEHGFCPGSPEPFTLDALSVKPFPIIIANGESVTLELQLTLNEEIAKGAQVSLKGTIHVEAKAMSASGELLACIWVRAVVDH